ncbi:hypothetical protein FQR65_LT15027 [Abscondita terminalis]|nr:hypothetical protein FQR65_LT15027 [Abscondita terminalis]
MSMTTRSMSKKQDKEIDGTMEEENEKIQETMEGESVKTTEVEETPVINQFDIKMLIELMKKNTEEIKKNQKNENKAIMEEMNNKFDGMNDKIDQMNETLKKQFEEQLMELSRDKLRIFASIVREIAILEGFTLFENYKGTDTSTSTRELVIKAIEIVKRSGGCNT